MKTQIKWLARSAPVVAILTLAMSNPDSVQADEPGVPYDTVLYWGLDTSFADSNSFDFGPFVGFTTSLEGDIGASGWTVSANAGFARSVDPGAQTNSFYGALLLGYQWHEPDFYVTVAGGVNVLHNDEKPSGSPTDGGAVGAIFQYGFETKAVEAVYLQSYGAYSTANQQVYAHAKAGYNTGSFRVGPEFTYFDEKNSDPTLRFGAFFSGIPLGNDIEMILSAGYQHELTAGLSDGFYGTVGFVLPLSLR